MFEFAFATDTDGTLWERAARARAMVRTIADEWRARPATIVLPPMRAPRPGAFLNHGAGLAPTPIGARMSAPPEAPGRVCADEACTTLLERFNRGRWCAPHERERTRAHSDDRGTDQHPKGCRCDA